MSVGYFSTDLQTVKPIPRAENKNMVSYHGCIEEVCTIMILDLSVRLKELRLEKRLQQDQLAALVILEKSSISMYENDMRQPSFKTLVRLADVLNVTTDFLLGRTSSSPIDLSGLTTAE